MAKVGYTYLAEGYEDAEQDKAWMNLFGCIKVVEDKAEDEKMRPRGTRSRSSD